MKKELLIFDFDGTIANTLLIALEILNEIGSEFSIPHIEEHQLVGLKSKSARELIKMSGLSWWQIPRFLHQARLRFKAHLHKIPPIEGMPEVIESFRTQGCRVGILTSNSEEGVRNYIRTYQLGEFEFVISPRTIFGKAREIKKILKHNHLSTEQVAMIGDEVRDMVAARKAGVDGIAVVWGFNSPEILQNSNPSLIVHSPAELKASLSALT